MLPGNCYLYNLKGRFIKGFSGRNYSGNGYAARGISSGLNHFSCFWGMGLEASAVLPSDLMSYFFTTLGFNPLRTLWLMDF
jgi:hypothetical protein